MSTHTDMFVVFSVALLCLVSVSHSAPLTCEALVRPLDQLDPHHLVGRWALVAASLTLPYTLDDVKDRGSRTVYFSNSSEASVYSYTQANRLDDQCYYHSHNFTIEGSTFTHKLDNFLNLTWSFLYTSCPDCLVVSMLFQKERMEMLDVYLFSKRRELEQKEMDEFRAQVECFKMSPPDVMNPTKELCPQPTTSDPTAETEEKTEGQKD